MNDVIITGTCVFVSSLVIFGVYMWVHGKVPPRKAYKQVINVPHIKSRIYRLYRWVNPDEMPEFYKLYSKHADGKHVPDRFKVIIDNINSADSSDLSKLIWRGLVVSGDVEVSDLENMLSVQDGCRYHGLVNELGFVPPNTLNDKLVKELV